jgi:hypothetical protein
MIVNACFEHFMIFLGIIPLVIPLMLGCTRNSVCCEVAVEAWVVVASVWVFLTFS